MPRPELQDHTGQRFGYLLVLRREGSTRGYAAWRCACDCGREVVVSGHKLRKGFKKACCLGGHRWQPDYSNRTRDSLRAQYPGEYKTFEKMHARCRDKQNIYYGGRGIAVCERWKLFKNFIVDMGPKPEKGLTIERKDNDKGYEPDNCRWATFAEQRKNLRRSVYVNRNGEKVLLLDLVEQLGLHRQVVYQRLQIGWSLEDALTVPVRPKKKNRKKRKG